MPRMFSRLILHRSSIALIVFLEYLQSIMVNFASSYIRGGIDAAPEEFSLAASCYAAIAVVMILSHRWLVQRFGYRSMLKLSLLSFGVGAAICACANNVPEFIVGRMVQALGASAFFTASRVQVLHYQGKERIPAMLCMATGIMCGSGVAPIVASYMVENYDWRGIFWIMIPMTVVIAMVVMRGVPEREPVENEQSGEFHPWGIMSLASGTFLLQFVLERTRFDIFTNGLMLWTLGLIAVALLLFYLRHEWNRDEPLISFKDFISTRYIIGLSVYFFGYVVVSACNLILPVLMVQGLNFAVQSTGWVIGMSSLISIPICAIHMKMLLRWPQAKAFLIAGLAFLVIFCQLVAGYSEEVTLLTLGGALLLLNGLFMPVLLGTAAFGTFRGVDDKVFSHAYQVKNAMREMANALGVSWATIILQMRTTLHYSRLAESTQRINPWYGNPGATADPWGLLSHPGAAALAQLAGELNRQSTLMACQDFFWGMSLVALVVGCGILLQRRFN